MYLQFLTLSFLIAVLLCLLGVLYCLEVRNKISGIKELTISFVCLAFLYSACVYASVELDPRGAQHRWISVTASLFAAVFFQVFFFKFPSKIFIKNSNIIFQVELLISFAVSAWFYWETRQESKTFHFNGHYWDLTATFQGRIVAFYSLLLSFGIVIVAAVQILRNQGQKRIALIGILFAFFLTFIVPTVFLALFRLGRVNAYVFVNVFAISVIAGFFVFHVFFVSYGNLQTSLAVRILTIVLAMALSVSQVMLGGLSHSIENEYDSLQSARIADLKSLPGAKNLVFISDILENPRNTISSDRPYVPLGSRSYFISADGKPIVVYRNETAKVEVGFSYESYRNFIHHYILDWAIRLIASLFILIVGFLIFMKISILNPLLELLQGVDRVEGGELSVQVEVRNRDEIGLLTKAFNSMVNAMREARQELQQYTSNLERTILERDSIYDAVPQERNLVNKTLIYASRSMQAVVDRVERIANKEQPVLITGETGTGKEIIAAFIHELGRGSDRPFVPINCAAVPVNLWESQIFGHSKGAFTDAKSDYAGLVTEAKGGTLFFDEIGEMPIEIQPKILRLLQERKYKNVGGRMELNAECRIIFATHRNLKEMASKGTFREDLYYRINVFEINIPPLRERRSDIPFLVNRFLENYSKQMEIEKPSISEEVMDLFLQFSWPGNIRELENCIIRTLVHFKGDTINVSDLPPEIVELKISKSENTSLVPVTNSAYIAGFEPLVSMYSRRLIEAALSQCAGNKSEAARLLKISRGKLQYQMRQLGMD
ncbi:sigma-54 interaction domain protein [Leptospira inadai serovar Lyme str. 10]|uniref:Sigma-54 interaction domain protein n=2 Tax=Leptospira inadai serovar Lyme TaxID=293084 RepID=V6HDZ6_9LEPT|nr:sigma-54-dependent Fis family transcriptional regulator [Leptospira inadai]EQA38471.1 sigma-54 interaction domain protein [Leptospira inadai serovar Lyme str. 10]PNV72258.1 sigma-54-dependent Fis family transcriptional regulator [Leptospira inadai serovar Lyme]